MPGLTRTLGKADSNFDSTQTGLELHHHVEAAVDWCRQHAYRARKRVSRMINSKLMFFSFTIDNGVDFLFYFFKAFNLENITASFKEIGIFP